MKVWSYSVLGTLYSVLFTTSIALCQTPSIVGSWHGTSTCVDKVQFPACNDEEVIYDVREQPPDSVVLRADKVVNGVREFMGEFTFGRTGSEQWAAEADVPRGRLRIELAVQDDALAGRLLALPSGSVVRRLMLVRRSPG